MSSESESRPVEETHVEETRVEEQPAAVNPPPSHPSPPPTTTTVTKDKEHHPNLWAIIATIVAVLALLLSFVSLAVAKNAHNRLDEGSKIKEVNRSQHDGDWRDRLDRYDQEDYQQFREWQKYRDGIRNPCDCVPPPRYYEPQWYYGDDTFRPPMMPQQRGQGEVPRDYLYPEDEVPQGFYDEEWMYTTPLPEDRGSDLVRP